MNPNPRESEVPTLSDTAATLLGALLFVAVIAATALGRGPTTAQPVNRAALPPPTAQQPAELQATSTITVAPSVTPELATATPSPSATATLTPTRTPSPTETIPSATSTPELTVTTVLTLTATVPATSTATSTATRESVVTDTPEPSVLPPTAAPEEERQVPPSPSPLPVLAEDHYWLERPIGPDAPDNRVARFYPYGSTANGTYQVHHGVEFVNPMNTPIRAAANGTVVFAGSDAEQVLGPTPDFYGQAVVVRLDQEYHGQPVFYLYGHIERWLVEVGQAVETGQVIAEVGMRGVALGPHLHLEVRVGQNDYWHTRNPELWVRPLPGFGNIAGRLLSADGMPISQRVTILLYQAAAPNDYWRETETYGRGVNPDDGWGENFLFGDVPVGDYIVQVKLNGQVFSKPVHVEDGKTAFMFPQVG